MIKTWPQMEENTDYAVNNTNLPKIYWEDCSKEV